VEILRPLRLRYFSPEELLRLFCFEDAGTESTFRWPEGVSTKTKYRLIGNSVNVLVVSALIECLCQCYGFRSVGERTRLISPQMTRSRILLHPTLEIATSFRFIFRQLLSRLLSFRTLITLLCYPCDCHVHVPTQVVILQSRTMVAGKERVFIVGVGCTAFTKVQTLSTSLCNAQPHTTQSNSREANDKPTKYDVHPPDLHHNHSFSSRA
jgi:hypothetical protein